MPIRTVIGMEINNSQHTYDTTVNSKNEVLMNLTTQESHFPQNLQSPHFGLSSLLGNGHSAPIPLTDTSVIRFLHDKNSDLNMEIPQFTCYYQQPTMIKDCHYSSKESKTVQTQTSPTSKTTSIVHLKPRIQGENLRKQINIDFKSLKLENPTISVRSRLLNDEEEDQNEERNRHLSDIELLRQVYDELRLKISQA
uniref:Cnn_1N domain-containing protein n=1 Tax=Elaeophora elaphi TaxID=1147741 RepID=A0A0R3RKK4_9BILA